MKKYLTVFHNGSNHDYHFIKRELEKEFEEEFTCLEENTKKHKSFSVQLTNKFKRIGKNGAEITRTISYQITIY